MKRDLTVYVASAWWRDCDPHTCVVALTKAAASKAIDEAIQARAEDEWDSGEPEWCSGCREEMTLEEAQTEHGPDCLIDAQAWSGVFAESWRSIAREHKGSPYREQTLETVKEDLRTGGLAYLETY